MNTRLALLSALCLIAPLGNLPEAHAVNFGTNITIDDGHATDSKAWYGAREDDEVEPGCVANQSWDLEGFYLDGTTLTVVGGFDFNNGNDNVRSGDLFLATGGVKYGTAAGNVQDGNGNQTILNSFGYDYALDLDFGNGLYDIYKVAETTKLTSVYYDERVSPYYRNEYSNPWRYESGGEKIGEGAIAYSGFGVDFSGLGLSGGSHNAFSVDLGFLDGAAFTSHFTIECGNDNLMGAAPVPEPATMVLLGTGLIGLAGVGRRKFAKG